MSVGRRARGLVLVVVAAVTVSLAVAAAVTAAGGITYVHRVGTASATKTSTTVTVKTTASVSAGDALVVSVMLGGLSSTGISGPVTASDPSPNDKYAINQDRNDGAGLLTGLLGGGGDRLVVMSALNVASLPSGTTITLSYPSASTAFVTVDEFKGIGSVNAGNSSSGAPSAFNSGPVSAVAGQMLYGVAGVMTSQNPTWNSGWSALAKVGNSSRRLSAAYQLPASSGSFNASGTTNGNWLAAEVSFSPPDAPPVAKLSVSPTSGVAPLSVTADASGSTDADFTPIASYTFDFGDGTVVGPQSGATASHTYSTASSTPYTVKVTVTDTAGLSSTATTTVAVNTEQPPTAQLSVKPTSGNAPLNVTADASGSSDPDGTAITYTFDFGDGTVVGPQAGATASHTYSTASSTPYTVKVTVTDTAGNTATATSPVTVNDAPPVAKLSASPTSGIAPLSVTADASGSTDPDGTAITYSFDFGDGTVVGPQAGATASHTYPTPGTYTATLTVTDTAGLSSKATATVTVSAEQPPVAQLTVNPTSGNAPLTVTADGKGSNDPDGTAITYSFDFGDQTPAVTPASGTTTASHTYSAPGTYTVTLTATDTAGLTSKATATVTVSDAPPTAKLNVSPSSVAPGATVTADGTGSTDSDGSAITYTFNFGDQTAAVGPQSGTTASHTYANPGTYKVTLTVTDTAGLTSQATATVTVSSPSTTQTNVYAGYYDTHHANTNPKPNPWQGSPGVVFQGTPDSSSGGWDTSAVRIDDVSGLSLPMVSLTVDIGTHHFALWSTTSLSAGQTLIAAQTAYENFDGSDENPAGCYGCDPTLCQTEVQSTVPVVHVTVSNGTTTTTTNYPDTKQVLNTLGVDSAGCPYTGTRNDESQNWQQLAPG